jgi:hypothetical protein
MSLPDRPEEWTPEEIESVLRELRARDPGKYKEVLDLIYSVSEDLSSTLSATP